MSDLNTTSSNDWTFQTEEEIAFEKSKLKISDSSENNFIVFNESPSILMNIEPTRRIQFYGKEGTEVGWVDFSEGVVTFGGNLDESAKAFFTAMKPYVNQHFEDAKNQFIHDVNNFMNKLYGQPRG